MDIRNYIINNFGYDEPVLIGELYERLNINKNTLRQLLKRAADLGEIARYEYKDGIYFIPNENSVLKKKTLNFNKVISKEYLIINDKRIGYITGLAFANKLQLTTQNPVNIEIVTQKESMLKREVDYKIRKLTLRRPRVKEVNEENFKILQVLDLLNNFEKVSVQPIEKAVDRIQEYLSGIKVDSEVLDSYLKQYPQKAQLNVWRNGVFNEITS